MPEDRLVVNLVDEFCFSVENNLVDSSKEIELASNMRNSLTQALLSMGRYAECHDIVVGHMRRDFSKQIKEKRIGLRQYDVRYDMVGSWIQIHHATTGNMVHLFLCEKETQVNLAFYTFFGVPIQDRSFWNMTQVSLLSLERPEAMCFPTTILTILTFLLEGTIDEHASSVRSLH